MQAYVCTTVHTCVLLACVHAFIFMSVSLCMSLCRHVSTCVCTCAICHCIIALMTFCIGLHMCIHMYHVCLYIYVCACLALRAMGWWLAGCYPSVFPASQLPYGHSKSASLSQPTPMSPAEAYHETSGPCLIPELQGEGLGDLAPQLKTAGDRTNSGGTMVPFVFRPLRPFQCFGAF